MADKYMQLVLTPAVQQAQDKYFGKHQVVEHAPDTDPLTPDEAEFIASRDSFYMATVSETGWPYVQHRGGSRATASLSVRATSASPIGWPSL